MHNLTKVVLLASTIIGSAAFAPSLYAENAQTPAQGPSASEAPSVTQAPWDHMKNQGMMGDGGGEKGMMGQGMMGGDMKGMMGMMTKMMETCNTMMQSHMDQDHSSGGLGHKEKPANNPNRG